MKTLRNFVLACAAVAALGSKAQTSAPIQEGFYRVQNYQTNRFAYVLDKTGSINPSNFGADMGAVALYLQDIRDRFCDPASVCYVSKVSHKHDVLGQGTSLFGIIGHYVQIQPTTRGADGSALYRITPLYAGSNIYLQDGQEDTATDYEKKGGSYIKGPNNPTLDNTFSWRFIPFTPNGAEYLGIAPKAEMKVGEKYYKPYLIGFDLTLLSPGMKAYYVSDIKSDAVVLKEIVGTVPAGTPIIVECSSTTAADNRVDVDLAKATPISGNKLQGQYFCYQSHGETGYELYNASTMRVLMVKEGKLVYGTPAQDDDVHTTIFTFPNGKKDPIQKRVLNGNESYLPVSSGFPAEMPVMTEGEYRLSHYTGDATSIVSMILKKSSADMNADFNGDAAVTIADLVLYIEYQKNK